jgi:hypothetical protein
MHRFAPPTLFILLLGLAGACAGAPQTAPSATQDPAAQAQATGEAATAAWRDAEATEERQTLAAGEQAATRVVLTAARLTEAAAERRATREAELTATVASATAQSQSMFDRVQELYDQGYLGDTGGTYHRVPDFDESWAQLNWYQWWPTGFQPTNFVLRTDVTWESASETADWWNSGCGFVFRIEDENNHYFAYLALDGRFYFVRRVNDRPGILASPYVARPDLPIGKATIEMIAEGSWFTFFVDGAKVHSRQDTALPEGELALTLVSGTNKDFGTRCQMRNVELWELQ